MNSKKIKGRMAECGVTQKELAEAIGLAPATISQKINGIRPLYLNEAEKIAQVLMIKESEFGSYFFGP